MMMFHRIFYLLILTVALAAANVAFSNGEDAVKYCRLCKNTGKIICKIHEKTVHLGLCSYRMDFPCGCLGLGWTVCDKGEELHPKETAAAREEADRERKALEAFLDGRRNLYDLLIFGREFEKEHIQHIEGEHFKEITTVRGDKLFKIPVSPHQMAHLYMFRCEEAFTTFAGMVEAPANYQPSPYGKWQLLMWSTVDQELKASHKMVGNTQYPLATGNARLLTICPFKPDSNNREEAIDDEENFHNVIHNMVHIMFEEWGGFVDGCFPWWFYEGSSHWVEYRLFNRVLSYCGGEAAKELVARDKKWETLIYKLAIESKDPPLLSMSNMKMQDLTFNHRLKSWSIVDWMMNTGTKKQFIEFIRTLKRSKSEGNSWRDGYEIAISEVDAKWKEWALVMYAPRTILKLEKENEARAKAFVDHQIELIKSLPQ